MKKKLLELLQKEFAGGPLTFSKGLVREGCGGSSMTYSLKGIVVFKEYRDATNYRNPTPQYNLAIPEEQVAFAEQLNHLNDWEVFNFSTMQASVFLGPGRWERVPFEL